jgi:DNA-binding transcriptional MerR regulator
MARRSSEAARLSGSVEEVAVRRRSPLDSPGNNSTADEASNDGFRGPQVCNLVGITYRQLDYWARTGLLRPSIADARGSGTQRLYSYTDLLELKVIKQLLDAGISLRRARRALECLREGLGADLASANLVLVGADSVLAHTDGEVVDLLRGGQGVLNIVPLAGVVEELDAAIVEISHNVQLGPASSLGEPASENGARAGGRSG